MLNSFVVSWSFVRAVQRALLEAVAKVSKKLVLVVVSAGGVDIDESLAHAVLWAPYVHISLSLSLSLS